MKPSDNPADPWTPPRREVGVLAAVRRRWIVVLVVLLLGAAGTALLTVRLPQQWAASAVVSFTPRLASSLSPDSVALVAERYAVEVGSDAAADRIAARLEQVGGAAVAEGIRTELEPGTGNLRITVTLDDRDAAVDAANGAAALLLDSARTDELVESGLSAPATARAADRTPPRSLVAAAAGATAVLLAFVVGVVVDRVRGGGSRTPGAEPAAGPRLPERPERARAAGNGVAGARTPQRSSSSRTGRRGSR